MTNGKIIIIKEGQLLTGRKQLSESTGIAESTVEDILKLLENEQQIQQQKTTKYRLVTILNWKEYQESDNKATTKQQQADTNKNVKNDNNVNTSVATAPQEYEIVYSDSDKKEKVSKAKYPHAKEVFSWFPRPQASWKLNTTELKHSELLFERGEKRVRAVLDFIAEQKGNKDFLYTVLKPSDLERKWEDIRNWKLTHGL